MANVRELLRTKNLNDRELSQKFIYFLITVIATTLVAILVFFYMVTHRPLPVFNAVSPQQTMTLIPHYEPNLRPNTLIKWASKAAVAAYTFDFANFNAQLAPLKPYFTPSGWIAYEAEVVRNSALLIQNQLFVNAVVSGPAVIGSEGPIQGFGYSWRILIPMTITTQSANTSSSQKKMAILQIVRVPTTANPYGIGIESIRIQ